MLKLLSLFVFWAGAVDSPEEIVEKDIRDFKRAQSWKEMVAPALYDNRAANKDLNNISDFSTCFLYPDDWAWNCFLDGYNLCEATCFKKRIVRLMHEALTFYIRDFHGSFWLHSPKIKTREKWKTKEEVSAWILDMSEKVFEWLEENEATDMGFFPSIFLGFLGEPTPAHRERIASQFEKALCIAGSGLALHLYPGEHVNDGPYSSNCSQSYTFMPRCIGELPGNMRVLALKVFEKVYGTFHQLSVFCHKPERWVLHAEAETLQKVCLVEPDWHLYNLLVEDWLDRRVEVASLIRKFGLDRGQKNLSLFVHAALKLAFDYVLRTKAHPEVCICYGDPATYLYAKGYPSTELPNAAQRDITKSPLKELNEHARQFLDVAFPMLKKRQQDVVELFELLLLPEGATGFLRLMEHCEEMRERFASDPNFYITSTEEIRYPLLPNSGFGLNGETMSRLFAAKEWGPLMRKRVLKLLEEGSENSGRQGDAGGFQE